VTDDDDDAPSEWKITALSRAMADFDYLLSSERHGAFFRSIETIAGLFEEQKRLTDRINTLYLLTFAGSCLVFLGPLPDAAKLSVFGIETSLSLIPQQIIAVVTAVAYSMFATSFASLMVLSQMISKTLQKEGDDHWQFFAGRFDASGLWATLIMPRTIGYKSPKRHIVAAFAIIAASFLSVVAHALVVGTAAGIALKSAITTAPWYFIVFAGFSVTITAVSILSLIAVLGWPLPFRIAKDDDFENEPNEEAQ
jgi:hypothetical protein